MDGGNWEISARGWVREEGSGIQRAGELELECKECMELVMEGRSLGCARDLGWGRLQGVYEGDLAEMPSSGDMEPEVDTSCSKVELVVSGYQSTHNGWT
jgi:hypothetical protein